MGESAWTDGQEGEEYYTNLAVKEEVRLLDDRPCLWRTVLQFVLEWYDVPKRVDECK